MSELLFKSRLEEHAGRVVRCGLCTDEKATSYCVTCGISVCNNCLLPLHDDVDSVHHRIRIITTTTTPTPCPSLVEEQKSVERRTTPPSTHIDSKQTLSRLEQTQHHHKSKYVTYQFVSMPTVLARKVSIPETTTPAQHPTIKQTTPRKPRPITHQHEHLRFLLFACLSAHRCSLFPHLITYNAHNDVATTNALLDKILETCQNDIMKATSIIEHLHAGGHRYDKSEELVDAIAYIHDEKFVRRTNANPRLSIPTVPVTTLYQRVQTGSVLMEMSTPNNGDCALYAVIVAALMPHLYDVPTFERIASLLVDPSQYSNFDCSNLRSCLQTYLEQGGMSCVLRKNACMQEYIVFVRMKMSEQLQEHDDALLVRSEQPDAYVEQMSSSGEYLDHRELSALSLLLQVPIHIMAIDTPVFRIHGHLMKIDVEKGWTNALTLHYTAGDEETGCSTSMSARNHYTAMVADPRAVHDPRKQQQEYEAFLQQNHQQERSTKHQEQPCLKQLQQPEKTLFETAEIQKDPRTVRLRRSMKREQEEKAAGKTGREFELDILAQIRAQGAKVKQQQNQHRYQQEKNKMMKATTAATSDSQTEPGAIPGNPATYTDPVPSASIYTSASTSIPVPTPTVYDIFMTSVDHDVTPLVHSSPTPLSEQTRLLISSLVHKHSYRSTRKQLKEMIRLYADDARLEMFKVLLDQINFHEIATYVPERCTQRKDHYKLMLLVQEMLDLSGSPSFPSLLCCALIATGLPTDFLKSFIAALKLPTSQQLIIALGLVRAVETHVQQQGITLLQSKLLALSAFTPTTTEALSDSILYHLIAYIQTAPNTVFSDEYKTNIITWIQHLYGAQINGNTFFQPLWSGGVLTKEKTD